jgi:hypothetical protein
MKTIKILVFGYLFGVVLTWLLFFIATISIHRIDLLVSHAAEIFQSSLFWGMLGAIIFGIIGWASRRQHEKRELEEAMRDYFRNQIHKEED